MTEINGDIGPDLRRVLTSLSEDLYWNDSGYYDAREEITERAQDLGFEIAGVSDNRIVLKVSEERLADYDEPLAVKIPQRRSNYPGGIKQNLEEIDLYRSAPDWLKDYLIPIEEAHPRGFWLVMRYAPPPEEERIEDRKNELLSREILTNEILSEQNWGEWQGDVYLTDYGLGISGNIPDAELRDWTEIVNEEDRRRGLIEPIDREPEDEEEQKSGEKEEEEIDASEATRVVASADILPDQKPDVRSGLTGTVVKTGEEISIETFDEGVSILIEQTEPRTSRHSQEDGVLISEETRISL